MAAKTTVARVAAGTGLGNQDAWALLKLLEKAGAARRTGEREKPASGKGAGVEVYELADDWLERATELLRKAAP